MQHNYEKTWETYVSSWKAETPAKKREIFKQCLTPENTYHDPLIKTENWDDFIAYMIDFHQQIPGGHFNTTYFLAHGNKSIARWEMKNVDNVVLGEGISYGEYDENGKLRAETGFFELPEA